jgi:hypothetical protein
MNFFFFFFWQYALNLFCSFFMGKNWLWPQLGKLSSSANSRHWIRTLLNWVLTSTLSCSEMVCSWILYLISLTRRVVQLSFSPSLDNDMQQTISHFNCKRHDWRTEILLQRVRARKEENFDWNLTRADLVKDLPLPDSWLALKNGSAGVKG